jgi:hypothetical protein
MRTIKKGATSQSLYVEILDSTSTTGARKTGLVFNTSGLTAYYVRNQGSATAITLATLAAANSAWSSGGFKEVDATNMPGVYRIDVPDAAFASGADDVTITIKGATGAAQVSIGAQLVAYDPQDATALGVSRLDAAVSSRMATYTQPTGFLAATFPAGTVANTTNITTATGITVSTNNDKTGYSLSSAGVQAIWDALTSALTTVGSIGKLLVDNVNATISSRLPTASITLTGGAVTVGTNNDKTGYTASTVSDKTGYSLTAAYDPSKTASQAGDAMTLTSGERTSVADALLNRDLAVGTDSGSPTVRTVRQALRFLRNKWTITTGTLTVYKEDDTTASWTSTVVGTAGADPVTSSDPA